jgi:geranylgeranyl pyrophosphate synthase
VSIYLVLFATAVADDILDVTATSEELGKTAGKDENTNKTTYVKLLGLEKSKAEVRDAVCFHCITDAMSVLVA